MANAVAAAKGRRGGSDVERDAPAEHRDRSGQQRRPLFPIREFSKQKRIDRADHKWGDNRRPDPEHQHGFRHQHL